MWYSLPYYSNDSSLKTAIIFLNERLRGSLLGYHRAIAQLLDFITHFLPKKDFLHMKRAFLLQVLLFA